MLWRQWRVVQGLFIHHEIWDSLCWLVTSHKPVIMPFVLHSAYLGTWLVLLEKMAIFSTPLMSLCWQRAHVLVKIPFTGTKLSSENKQRKEIRGSSGVNTRPDYYSSLINKRNTLGCSLRATRPEGNIPLSSVVASRSNRAVGIS